MILKKIILIIIIISLIYWFYTNNIEGFNDNDREYLLNATTNRKLLPDYPPVPQFVYASPYDFLVNDVRVKFSGLKSEALDATNIPRVISKYVFPYKPENYYISLRNNKDNKPWNHHPINSIKRDLIPKYDNVYYYELENDKYMTNFYKTFTTDQCTIPKYDDSNWGIIIDASKSPLPIEIGYYQLVQYIQNTLNNSSNFVLKEDLKYNKKIQIVHDIFINYKAHNTEPNTYLYRIELLLYRENKYNGKHIGLHCVVSNPNFQNATQTIALPPANIYNELADGGHNIENTSSIIGPNLIYTNISSINTAPGITPGIAPAIASSIAPSMLSPISNNISPATIDAEYDTLKQNALTTQLLGTSNMINSTGSDYINLNTTPINPDWNFIITEAELIGDVPEDMITLYPIVISDPYSLNQMNVNHTNDYANDYAGILPTTQTGQVYNGFGIITSNDTDAIVKQHLLNYVNVDSENNKLMKKLLNMDPKDAELTLRLYQPDIRNKILSNLPSDFAAHVLLNMDADILNETIAGMDRSKAVQALYLINNPDKLSITKNNS